MGSNFFNTTGEVGDLLEGHEVAAMKQNDIVLEIMKKHDKLTPSEMWEKFKIVTDKTEVPLTSIRRAMSTLYSNDVFDKLDEKKVGSFGRNEHLYTLKGTHSNS